MFISQALEHVNGHMGYSDQSDSGLPYSRENLQRSSISTQVLHRNTICLPLCAHVALLLNFCKVPSGALECCRLYAMCRSLMRSGARKEKARRPHGGSEGASQSRNTRWMMAHPPQNLKRMLWMGKNHNFLSYRLSVLLSEPWWVICCSSVWAPHLN